MRTVIAASVLFAVSTLAGSASVNSAVAAGFVAPLPQHQSTAVKVHHRYWYGGYYGYYSPYPAYAPYYYGAPVVAYPPPVVYYPGPRYYPGPAIYGGYGPYGGVVVRRPYDSYYVDW